MAVKEIGGLLKSEVECFEIAEKFRNSRRDFELGLLRISYYRDLTFVNARRIRFVPNYSLGKERPDPWLENKVCVNSEDVDDRATPT
jgi:hypothetical protein